MKKNHEIRAKCTKEDKEGFDGLHSITETGLSKTAFILALTKAGANLYRKRLIKKGFLEVELK